MKTLYVGAHPDDVEIGCAGTILKRGEEDEAHYAVFSLCGEHSGLSFTEEDLNRDLLRSVAMMGIREDQIHIWNFENTRLRRCADEIREKLEELREKIEPERVYVHSVKDMHQDHQTVAEETVRAFRLRELRFYEVTSTTQGVFNPNLYVDISEQLKGKTGVLKCYETQRPRPFFKQEYWRSRAIFRGIACGVQAAEAFELIWKLE